MTGSRREAPARAPLDEAIQYVQRTPGKRLRPRLLMAAARACSEGEHDAAAPAQAIELIHTYSLIHDDLPAMDDDALRRGQPTLHVAFDQATAILVGDGMQARAFELIATDTQLTAQQRVELSACLARAAGFEGMVGGQALDMASTNRELSLTELKAMHRMKTGALITAALEMGAIVGEASGAQRSTLVRVGERIGLAFQIIDDVIDVRSDSRTLGKTSGKDAASGKSTYVGLLGLEGAEAEASRLHGEALELVSDWSADAEELRTLLNQIVYRDR